MGIHRKILLPLAALPIHVMAENEPKNRVGGQAIIEGVMMRGPEKISWAVRKPDGLVTIEDSPFISLSKKHTLLNTPVVRGAINLYESFTIGYRALTRSAEIAIPEEKQDNDKKGKKNAFLEKAYTTLSFVFAFAFSIGLFMYTPLWILSHFISKESAFAYNIFAGMIRIGLFLAYLILISFWKDIRRVFEYHGAEHKAIFTFEDGKELILENMRPYSTMHPRCGTSFLLLVGLVCILLFSIVDAAFIHLIGPYPHVIVRFVVHFLLVPLVAGTSYEVLRLSDKYQHLPIVSLLIRPGLWLQKITTREPDEHQLEVASSALKAAI